MSSSSLLRGLYRGGRRVHRREKVVVNYDGVMVHGLPVDDDACRGGRVCVCMVNLHMLILTTDVCVCACVCMHLNEAQMCLLRD